MPGSLWYLPKDEGPSPSLGEQDRKISDVLIYFVTGNPGIIDYYGPFLSTLSRLLQSAGADDNDSLTAFHVYGRGLSGFDDNDHEPFSAERPPRDLAFQIKDTADYLSGLRVQVPSRRGRRFDSVILVGHSVGAFIVLEIFHRHLQDATAETDLRLKAGILLFPTVTHIAQSPSGRRVMALRAAPAGPFLVGNAHRVASVLLRLSPLGLYGDATVRFLKSRDGVWQAIYLGLDELRVIAEEKWADDLWEVPEVAGVDPADVPKFVFFFGKDDHWVANEHRDEFVARREEHRTRVGPAHKRARTRIIVAEDNVAHAFCIHHSEMMAEKVNLWIREICARP